MKASAFHTAHEIERFLERKPEALKDVVFELRNLVGEIAPHATEKILWGGLSYYDASRRGPVRDGICQIEIHADHVRLSFIHLESDESTPWEALLELVRAAARFDPAMLKQEN